MNNDDNQRRVYGKYIIEKADGSTLDPEACYFVLRLDKDEAARKAARAYAEECNNAKLASDLIECVNELERPACGCRSVGECWHGPVINPVWRASDPCSFPEARG